MTSKEIQLSNKFKNVAIKSIFAILFFIITYLFILVLALAFAGLCIAGGIALVLFKPMFVTAVIGIGLSSLGILNLIFLLKFLFKSHKIDRSNLIEIHKHQEPNLFKMINDLVLEVGTTFPKKVYLTAEVNASVFYDSSFWSMFLPIKKNLAIGIGLVNSVTKEELKAILAHEFGHFSQRTMKVGSYVYNVNQVIFNMLYDNESYENLIQKWAQLSGYFTIFVVGAIKINEGIQWILRKMYDIVNKNYMGLSREMEFHADEIAANVSGYVPLKKSLLRLSLADSSFNEVLNFYSNKISENIRSENIYKDQSAIIHFLVKQNNIKTTNNLPDISLEEQSKYDKSKLVIDDQWASHPSINDRIKRLEKTGIDSLTNLDVLANDVFTDIIFTQKQLTNKIFEGVIFQGEIKTMSTQVFIQNYEQEILSNSFSKIYNCYYNDKNPLYFDLSKDLSKIALEMSELFSDQKVDLVYSSIALQNDISILKNIAGKTINIKSFDYDGVRYINKNASELVDKLNSTLDVLNEKIRINDSEIYNYFLMEENKQDNPKQLAILYSDFFAFDKIFESKYDIYTRLLNELQFIVVTTPIDQIIINLKRIQPLEETLKREIDLLLSDSFLNLELTQEIKDSLEKYIGKELQYFAISSYLDENLNILNTALSNYSFLLLRKYFLMKKSILTYQENLITNKV